MNKQDLQQIDALLKRRLGNFATKDELKIFVTKDDLRRELSRFAVKKDLDRFATKEDLSQELKQFATKEDLKAMKNDIVEEIADVINDFVDAIDKQKADRTDLNNVEQRVTKLENHVL